jgi:hypothetical protein
MRRWVTKRRARRTRNGITADFRSLSDGRHEEESR